MSMALLDQYRSCWFYSFVYCLGEWYAGAICDIDNDCNYRFVEVTLACKGTKNLSIFAHLSEKVW